MTHNIIPTRVAELSATLKPIKDFPYASYITSAMVEEAEDCNSYNASYYCNGWIKPCFEGDFRGCLMQSVAEYQVLRFYYICTRLEGLAYDEIPEDWDADDAPDYPEMEITDTIEFKQLWFNQSEQYVIHLNDLPENDYILTYVLAYDSLQDWAFEPRHQSFIRHIVQEYEYEQEENDCTLDVIFSPCIEQLTKYAPDFAKQLYAISEMRSALDFARSLKIAIRHKFQFPTTEQETRIYLDYLKLLDWAGIDIYNPQYICREDFVAEHDRLNNRRTEILANKEKAEARRQEADFAELHSWLFGIQFDDEHFHYQSLDSVEAYRIEGEIMHHCIFRCKFYNKHHILAMHITDHEGNRVATCTIDLQRRLIDQIQPMCDDTGFFNTYGFPWQDTNDYKHIFNTLMARIHTFPKQKPVTNNLKLNVA